MIKKHYSFKKKLVLEINKLKIKEIPLLINYIKSSKTIHQNCLFSITWKSIGDWRSIYLLARSFTLATLLRMFQLRFGRITNFLCRFFLCSFCFQYDEKSFHLFMLVNIANICKQVLYHSNHLPLIFKDTLSGLRQLKVL